MFFKHNLYSILWALMMLLMSFIPKNNMPNLMLGILPFDKVLHFSQFSFLVFMLFIGFIKQHAYLSLRFKTLQYVLMVSIPYAVLLEMIHLLLLTRSFEWTDMLANLLGCAGGVALFYVVYRL